MQDIDYLKKYMPKEKLEEGIKKLKNGEPVQYIVGDVNFMGCTIKVNHNCLIPRFETEYLTEKIINKEKNKKNLNILDIGTGSGAIAITLDKYLDAKVDALDISKGALEVAKENNKLNKTNVNLFESDLFQNVTKKYDIIVSNPPYIAYDEEIEDIVKNNEPAVALFAGDDGLEYYEKIIKDSPHYLNKKGLIAFEIGASQADKIINLSKQTYPNAKITKEKDLAGYDRYIFIET